VEGLARVAFALDAHLGRVVGEDVRSDRQLAFRQRDRAGGVLPASGEEQRE